MVNKTTKACEPLDLNKTYKVGTNEFLAPAGGDGYGGFKYMTNITYWGDMLNAVNAYVAANYGTAGNRLQGPERRRHARWPHRPRWHRCHDSGSIVPITILHHNDSHGNLAKGSIRRLHPAGHADQAGTAAQPRPHPAAQRRRQHPGRLR